MLAISSWYLGVLHALTIGHHLCADYHHFCSLDSVSRATYLTL